MNQKDAEEILNKYTSEINLVLMQPYQKCDNQSIFCLALLYTSLKIAYSIPLPKDWLAALFKKSLEQYEDGVDNYQIYKQKIEKSLQEAFELIKENAKDPEVS